MAIQGLRTTQNFVTDQRPKNWREGILLLSPNGQAPLTALTAAMTTKKTDDPEFNWWDKIQNSRRAALSADLDAVETALPLVSGAQFFKDGDMLWVEQGSEIVQVNGDPGSDTVLNVLRGAAGTTAATADFDGAGANPFLVCIGSANEEGSDAPTGVNFDPTKRTNYTQIFRNTLEATRTATKTRLRTGDAIREAKRECLELHSMDMERAFWFGSKSEGTRNGKPMRTTDGVMNVIDTNNIKTADSDYASGVTMAGLEEYMYEMFKWGSDEKMAFMGNRAMLTIQQIIRKNTTYNIQFGLKEFGMNVSRLTSPFGELVMKSHPLFNRMVGGTTGTGSYYGVESWMFALDMAELVYRPLDDTKYQKKLGDNGVDGEKSGYLTETGMEVHHPTAHYLIKNLHTAAADS